jgi:chromosomal replication initiator protein
VRIRTAQEIWDAALGELQLQVSRANYRTWLEKTKGLSYQENLLVLEVPNTFVSEYLDKNLRSLIEKTLIGITQSDVRLTFSIDNGSQASDWKQTVQVPTISVATNNSVATPNMVRLNPKYTFESFVVSHCNRLAFAAAQGAAQKPGLSSYNPLYIYGGIGLGKTHLLNAIGNAASARGTQVIYVNAEQFTNEFVNALRERRTDDFRNRYRSAEMLLIDDIQFLSGKEQTEESFFHIFNELRHADRQIALTSNCPPHSIPLIEERLRSRLEWGLSAGIQQPDFDTRLAILSDKASKEGVTLSPSVLEFIAQKINQNIRELEGSLNRVVAYAKLLKTPVTPELAGEALEDIADKKPGTLSAPNQLLELIAGYFNIDVADLRSSKRDKQTTLARQVGMYIMREQTDYSLSRIGREFGGRQAISVSQAHDKIATNIQSNPELSKAVNELQQKIKQ